MSSHVLESFVRKLSVPAALLLLATGCNTRVYVEGAESESGEGDGEEGWDPEEPEVPVEPEEPAWPDASCGNGVVDPGEFCHELQTTIPAGIDPCALTVADYDHDGVPDAAVPNSDFANQSATEHLAHVMLGQGNGSLLSAVAHHAGGPLPVGIDSGDFDGDGNPDLVVANYEGQEVNLLLGDGGGGFTEPKSIPIGESADTVSAGDVDLDGFTDLVVTTSTRNGVAVVRNLADGPGTVEWFGLDAYATHATFADVDHDGAPELIVTMSYPDVVLVAPGNGDGSFGAGTKFDVNYGPTWIFVDDVDADANPDLLVTNGDGTLDVLRGDGSGGFAPAANLPVGFQLQSVTAGDFDMDGHLDAAVSDEGTNEVVFAVGMGPGGFAERYAIPVGSRPVSIRRADFNLDGVLDVAVANQLSNSVSVIVSNP